MNQILLHNTIPQILSKAIFFVVTIITTAIIARDLGPEKYGYYTIIFVYLTFVAVLADIGLQTIAVRESSRYEKKTGDIAGTLFWIKVILFLIVSSLSIIFIFIYDFHSTVKLGFAIALIGQFFMTLSSIPNTIFQSKLKIKFSAISEIIGHMFLLCSVIAVFLISFSTNKLLLYILVGAISSAIIFFVGLRLASKIEKIIWSFNKETSALLIKETLPLSLIIILSQIHFRGDSLLLSLLKPEIDVGIYGLSFKFFEASLIVPLIVSTVILPLMSKQSSSQGINEIANKCFYILMALGLLVCLSIFFFSPFIIETVAGIEYEEAVLPTKFLGLAILFGYINNLFVNIVIVKNRQKDIVAISIFAVIVNIIFNLIFIPHYSYIACALIKVFTEFLGMAYMGYLAYRASSFIPFGNLLKNTR